MDARGRASEPRAMDLLDVPAGPALAALLGSEPKRGSLTTLAGDASMRRYYRLELPDPPRSLVIMRLPLDATRPEEATGDAPAPTELPFLAVQRELAARGVRVPKVLGSDLERGIVLLEDLGDETFERRVTPAGAEERAALYDRAVDVLVDLHTRCTPVDDALVLGRRFDREVIRWELDHFREWGIEAIHGPLPAADRAELDGIFDAWTEIVLALPSGFTHRDYQSRNLMIAPGGELAVIDFQDALIGPRVYDLVALMCDSYVALDGRLQAREAQRYASGRGFANDEIARELSLVAVQRKLKDAGRFVFIDRVRKNPGFLGWYPQSLVYVGRALARLSTDTDRVGQLAAQLSRLLAAHVPGFPDRCVVPTAVSRVTK